MPPALQQAPPVRRRPRRRRTAWRQRLVEVERGATAAFRADSIFFVHLFAGCLACAAGGLLGLPSLGWAVLTLALTVAVVAELFRQVVRALLTALDPPAFRRAAKAARLAAAAVAAATFGAAATIVVLFAARLWNLFGK